MVMDDALKLQLQNGQRCSQLMGSVRRKAVDVLECVIEACDHPIQRSRKTFQFIPSTDHRNALAQIAGGNALSSFCNLIDRLQRSPHEPITADNRQRDNERSVDRKGQKQSVKHNSVCWYGIPLSTRKWLPSGVVKLIVLISR